MMDPNDYSRKERYSQSVLLSHKEEAKKNGYSRSGQKVTFFSICFIAILMLIFLPRMRKSERYIRDFRMGSYNVELQRSGRWLSMKISHVAEPGESATSEDQFPMGWIIQDKAGTIIHREMDIPPPPGQSREFQYKIPADIQPDLRVLASGKETFIQPSDLALTGAG